MNHWAPLSQDWIDRGGLYGLLEGSTDYLAPTDEQREFMLNIQRMFTTDPETAVEELLPTMSKYMAREQYVIIPLTDVQQCVVINADIRNVPTGGIGISWNFSMEQFFYENPEEH